MLAKCDGARELVESARKRLPSHGQQEQRSASQKEASNARTQIPGLTSPGPTRRQPFPSRSPQGARTQDLGIALGHHTSLLRAILDGLHGVRVQCAGWRDAHTFQSIAMSDPAPVLARAVPIRCRCQCVRVRPHKVSNSPPGEESDGRDAPAADAGDLPDPDRSRGPRPSRVRDHDGGRGAHQG